MQPALAHREVRRPQLEARLDEVVPGGVALLSASAGFGKSVLVRQWTSRRPALRVAALSLTSRHDDAVTLARNLVATICAAAPEVDPTALGLSTASGGSLGEDFVDRLQECLATIEGDIVLVIEDLHVLSNRAILADLGSLASSLPATTRMVATTRSDPPWHLPRLRLAGTLTEIRSADLAFEGRQAKTLLVTVARRELSDEVVTELVDHTDGWAAGLQLAAISLRTAVDPVEFVTSFTGSDQLVSEYLLDEVIERQEEEVRDFLLQTSILDQLTPELCDAVTGEGNASRMLVELYRRSMFLIPLESGGTIFRYHHLFAEVLRYRLAIDGPEPARQLHRRAAGWLIAHGHEEQGIEHLIRAGDHDEAVRTIATVGHRLFERGESATVVRWLDDLGATSPDSTVEAMVHLMAAQIGADDAQGAAETYRRILRSADLTPGERTVAHTLYATQVTRGLAPETVIELTAEVRTSLVSLGPDDIVDFLGVGGLESVRLMNEHSAALAHFLGGDLHRAADLIERARAFSGMAYPLWRIHLLGSLALVRAWQGHSTDALGIARTALEAARDFGVSRHQACVLAYLATALVHLDRVELEDAERTLAETRPRVLTRSATVAYFDLHGTLEAWLTALREGSAEALEVLREPAAAGTEAPVLREGRRALRMRLLVGAGNLAAAKALLGGAPSTGELSAARVDLSLADKDARAARVALDAWTPEEDNLRDSVRHLLRTFAVLEAEGDDREARKWLERAVAAARGDRLRWPFLEVPAALRALRRNPLPDSSWLTTDLVWKAAVAMNPRVGAQDGLTEPLTQRELDVLAYLPGRMRNQEIAADMYVSVNTVKTHVASIYRKLGVTERNEAVERATGLGLL